MVEQTYRPWWGIVLRGIIAILFGVLALAWPGITLDVLVLFFGAYMFLDGVFAIVSSLTHPTGSQRWLVFLEGLVGIWIGIVTFFRPGLTALALLYLIAAWGVITGLLEILAALRFRREMSGEWMLILGGILSVLFGFGVALFPAAAGIAIVYLIGAYAIVFGLLMLVLAFRSRGPHRAPAEMGSV